MLKLNIKSNNYVYIVYIMCIIVISLFITSTLFIIPSYTSAMSYQSSNNIEFNLNPTISISITGGDLSIANLVPGSVSDSNIITVTTERNAISGYTLSSTVGTTSNLSNELRKNGTDTTNKFVNLTANQPSLSNFSDNEWGYSYSTDNGSTWISGDIDSSSTGYNGYTYDTTTSTSETITHLSTFTPDSTTIKYKIGAKAGATQLAGNYTNTINFTAITKANPEDYPTYMQNLNPTLCTNTPRAVVDNRDNEIYIIQRLADDNCWMLDNLRLNPVAHINDLDSTNTNASNTTLGYLKGTTTGTTSDQYATSAVSYWTSNYSYSDPLIAIKNANDTSWNPNTIPNNSTLGVGSRRIGVYYNYCAASAGSYCYGNGTSAGTSSGNATESLCPYGWRMPTGGSDGEFYVLYTNSNYNNYTAFKTALSLPLSGYFNNGSATYQGRNGYWWSSTYYDNNYIHRLDLNSDESKVYSRSANLRAYGHSLRCLLDS